MRVQVGRMIFIFQTTVTIKKMLSSVKPSAHLNTLFKKNKRIKTNVRIRGRFIWSSQSGERLFQRCVDCQGCCLSAFISQNWGLAQPDVL